MDSTPAVVCVFVVRPKGLGLLCENDRRGVESESLRRAASELRRDVTRIAPTGFVPATCGSLRMYSKTAVGHLCDGDEGMARVTVTELPTITLDRRAGV